MRTYSFQGDTLHNLLKMVLMTMIGRIPDGLPLAATMQEDEQVSSVFELLPVMLF